MPPIEPSSRLPRPNWSRPDWIAVCALNDTERTPCPSASPATTPSPEPMLTVRVSRTATTPPTIPAMPRASPRRAEPFCSRRSTWAVNRAASGIAGARAKRRSMSGSNSSADMLRPPQGLCGLRLEPRTEFIQTTFDMRFHRAEWQIEGRGDLGMGHARAVTEGDAQALRLTEALQRLVQVDPAGMIGRRSHIFAFQFSHIASFLRDALDVEPGGDALDPGREGAVASELGAALERLDEGVLGDVVGQGGLGAHAPQQAPHRRAVAAHELSELAPSARRREGGG